MDWLLNSNVSKLYY